MPTSRATRVTSAANDASWSTIVLTVFFSWRISPRTSPVIFFEIVTGIIFGFQYFAQAYVAAVNTSADRSAGGPQNSMLFYSVHLYQQGFVYFKMGYASAMAWVLFIISLLCTVAVVRGSKRWVHYQGGAFLR